MSDISDKNSAAFYACQKGDDLHCPTGNADTDYMVEKLQSGITCFRSFALGVWYNQLQQLAC